MINSRQPVKFVVIFGARLPRSMEVAPRPNVEVWQGPEPRAAEGQYRAHQHPNITSPAGSMNLVHSGEAGQRCAQGARLRSGSMAPRHYHY
jgi:hypothetical protein